MRIKIFILIILLLLLTACSEEQPPIIDRIPAVKTLVVTADSGTGVRTFSAQLEAATSAALSFPVGGTVAEVAVDVGDTVTSGKILAKLDPAPFDIEVRSAEADRAAAQSALLNAKSQLARFETLLKKGVVARVEYDNAATDVAAAQSKLELAQAKLYRARDNRRRTTIVAPFDGKVSEKNIATFQEAGPGKPALTVVGLEGFEAAALVPESIAKGLRIGDPLSVAIPSLPNLRIDARVAEIGAVAEAGAAVSVLAALDAGAVEGKSLFVGMAATMSLPLQSEEQSFVVPIPLSALAMDDIPRLAAGGGPGKRAPLYVFRPKEGTVELRLVEVAELRGNMLAVSSGLNAGEEVVVAGASFLEDGMRVRRWEPETPREETNFKTLNPTVGEQ